jgi:chromate transporter
VRYGPLRPVAAAILGLQCVVVALLVQAVQRLGARTLMRTGDRLIALGAFLAVALLHASLPAVVAAGALAGLLLRRDATTAEAPAAVPAPPAWRPVARVLGVGFACWLVPLALLAAFPAGPRTVPVYLYFTRVALGGFGGAYAVLAWVNQELVAAQGWLQPADLLAGLALAETTPGPLLIVLQFYGFVSGWQTPGAASPATSALACGALASVATFLPSFVLVLALAPLVEWLQSQRRLAACLAGVSASVVGVIASFALTVMLAVLWPHGLARGPELSALVLSLAAGFVLARLHVPLPWVLAGGALAGFGLSLVA